MKRKLLKHGLDSNADLINGIQSKGTILLQEFQEYSNLDEGDMGACSIAVSINFLCDITVFYISRCGIAVSSWSAVCGIRRFWTTVYSEIQISLAYFGIPVVSKTLLL